MAKIVLDFDEFKDFIEAIEDSYTKTYRGDWDWRRDTNFEVKDGYILKRVFYSDNGVACPDDREDKILFFEKIDE